jgi:hypothetical protein
MAATRLAISVQTAWQGCLPRLPFWSLARLDNHKPPLRESAWNIVIPYKNYVIPAQAGNEVTSGQPNSHSIGTNYRCCESGGQELGSRLRGSDEEFWAIQAIGGSYLGDNAYFTAIP